MRESIGTSFMLNFIVLFIFLVFAFLAGTFSYYKAYRVNNYIVNSLEIYEGYNEYSKDQMDVHGKTRVKVIWRVKMEKLLNLM